ncbi:hypothetical protein LJC32_00480 [Oscillospiraceae bacterium OttesenSCG-928-F05]|nr:hypothetical protein [Oscillospiraceae bacterium OttesenSCG-928-F05]
MQLKKTIIRAVAFLLTAALAILPAYAAEADALFFSSIVRIHAEDGAVYMLKALVLQFEGAQDDLDVSDLRDVVVTKDGETVPVTFRPGAEKITVAATGGKAAETHFKVYFEMPLTALGTYQISGVYKDTPFTTVTETITLAKAPSPYDAPLAVPSALTLQVGGEAKPCALYDIDGAAYVKLRDLAMALDGTESQFSIAWDPAAKAVSLKSGEAYTPVGGELAGPSGDEWLYLPSPMAISVDGAAAELTTYLLEGNNYVGLEDMAELFGFTLNTDAGVTTITPAE